MNTYLATALTGFLPIRYVGDLSPILNNSPPLTAKNLTWERGRLARAPGYRKMGKLFKTRSLVRIEIEE